MIGFYIGTENPSVSCAECSVPGGRRRKEHTLVEIKIESVERSDHEEVLKTISTHSL